MTELSYQVKIIARIFSKTESPSILTQTTASGTQCALWTCLDHILIGQRRLGSFPLPSFNNYCMLTKFAYCVEIEAEVQTVVSGAVQVKEAAWHIGVMAYGCHMSSMPAQDPVPLLWQNILISLWRTSLLTFSSWGYGGASNSRHRDTPRLANHIEAHATRSPNKSQLYALD